MLVASATPPRLSRLRRHSRSQDQEDIAVFKQCFDDDALDYRGVFVEMGALDGLTYSNSFAYESALNWTGVLIEANPEACPLVWRNRPHARVLCSGVSKESRERDGSATWWHGG